MYLCCEKNVKNKRLAHRKVILVHSKKSYNPFCGLGNKSLMFLTEEVTGTKTNQKLFYQLQETYAFNPHLPNVFLVKSIQYKKLAQNALQFTY